MAIWMAKNGSVAVLECSETLNKAKRYMSVIENVNLGRAGKIT